MTLFLRQLFGFLYNELEIDAQECDRSTKARDLEYALRGIATFVSSRYPPYTNGSMIRHNMKLENVTDALQANLYCGAAPLVAEFVTASRVPTSIEEWPVHGILGVHTGALDAIRRLRFGDETSKYARVATLVRDAMRSEMSSAINHYFSNRDAEWCTRRKRDIGETPVRVAEQYLACAIVGDTESTAQLYNVISLLYSAPFLMRDPHDRRRIVVLLEDPVGPQ